jgi:hypothetical protein
MVVEERVDGILGRIALNCVGFAYGFLTGSAAPALLNMVLIGS